MKSSKIASLLSLIMISQLALPIPRALGTEITQKDVENAESQMLQVEKEVDALLSKDPDASSVKGSDCAKLYQAKVIKKAKRKQKVRNALNKATLGGTVGGIALFFFASLTGNLPLVAGAYLGTLAVGGSNIYMQDHNVKSPKFRETLFMMSKHANKEFKQFTADVKKKSPTATDLEVTNAVQFGFESGGFCRGEKSNPMNRQKMVKFVAEHIQAAKK